MTAGSPGSRPSAGRPPNQSTFLQRGHPVWVLPARLQIKVVPLEVTNQKTCIEKKNQTCYLNHQLDIRL